jgi:hypothetical protein
MTKKEKIQVKLSKLTSISTCRCTCSWELKSEYMSPTLVEEPQKFRTAFGI